MNNKDKLIKELKRRNNEFHETKLAEYFKSKIIENVSEEEYQKAIDSLMKLEIPLSYEIYMNRRKDY